MEQRIIYVGLDVHKDTIAVALAEAGKRGELREYGKIANTPAALRTLAAKLASHGWRLRFCYEAGPCGYGIQRQLSEAGHECVVVAPSLIPRKPGDRVKTDRRDAINLAKLHQAGELSSAWVPGRNHEGGQWRGAAHVDRGGMELPVSSTYRSRSPSAPRKVEQANPRHSLEGPGATLPSISQARPCGEIEDRDHRRDCARAFGLRLGDRETDATRNRVGRRS